MLYRGHKVVETLRFQTIYCGTGISERFPPSMEPSLNNKSLKTHPGPSSRKPPGWIHLGLYAWLAKQFVGDSVCRPHTLALGGCVGGDVVSRRLGQHCFSQDFQ